MSVIPLRCRVQHYAWGKVKQGAVYDLVHQPLMSHVHSDSSSEPYAELWMGTHPNGCSLAENVPLSEVLRAEPKYLGDCSELPYLFKVLSVNKALSIQAHPDQDLARRLFSSDPTHYKDPHHKPELACALSEFRGFMGFRYFKDIQTDLGSEQEFSPVALKHKCLSDLFKDVMRDPQTSQRVASLVERLFALPQDQLTNVQQLCISLASQFPHTDVGLLAPYFFNMMTLQPGQAIFIPANVPHAYLCGDCIEIMACSDNVVRAGLTPKFVDVETLCSMLTYNEGKPVVLHGESSSTDANLDVKLYTPPVDEFKLLRVLFQKPGSYEMSPSRSACIVLCVSGESDVSPSDASSSTRLTAGSVVLLSAKSKYEILGVQDDTLLFIAMWGS